MVDWSPLIELVEKHQRFVLTTHIRPDCDALGSLLAMDAVLRRKGKQVLAVGGFAVPPNYRFADRHGRIKQLGVDVAAAEIEACEALVVLDTSAWAQLGPMADVVRQTRLTKAIVDHHVSGDDMGALLLKDTAAEATGRLVVEAADALGVPLDAEIAVAAFLALATDTGWFRFSSTTADTLRLAARLVDAGAVPDRIYKDLYENETAGRLKLMGRAMARAELERDGRLIYTWLELSDFAAAGALPSDSEDIINTTLSVGGTEVALIFVEQQGGAIKVSFRSRSAVDCAKLAERFGGGGHKKAAGATLEGPLAAARGRTLDAVRTAMG